MRLADRTVLEAHGSSRRAMAARHADGSWLQRVIAALLLSKEMWLVYASSFLCGRASLGSGIFPFGLALFWTVARSGQRTHAVGAALGVVLGMATAAPAYRWLAVLVTLLGGLFLLETEPSPARARRPLRYLWRQALFLALGHLAARLLFANLFEEPLGSPVWLVIEASLVTTSTVIWGPLALLWGSEGRSHFSREEWVGIALFCVMLSLGLAGLQSGPIVPSELWNRLVTLVGASIGGATAGAAVGTAMGWIMGMHGSVPFGGTGVYALAGLLAGLFSFRGKLMVGAGFLLGHLLLSVQIASPAEIVYSLLHALLAVALLVVVPGGWLRALERALPGSRARERFVQVREERLRQAVSDRLAKMGSLLAEMGRIFAVAGAARDEEAGPGGDTASVVRGLTVRLCSRCPGYRKCWDEHLYQTYKEVLDFIQLGRIRGELRDADMPLPLRQRCLKPGHLTQTLHAMLVEREERLRWHARLEGQINVVPAQLQGVASLLEGLADQVRVEIGRSDEVQVILADALREMRIPADVVEVQCRGTEGRFEVLIERPAPCDRIGIWREQVTRVVTRALGAEYVVWQEVCDQDGRCSLRYVPRPPFCLDHASVSIPKEEGVSGDAFHAVDLVDGRVAVMLSDGMGSGAQAALQSETAVSLLATLLETGFDLRSAVRSVNSLLLMRSTEETFATLDAVVIDQFTGRAAFLKVGSAPSFLLRGREVEVIRSDTLPVGIVQQVDVVVEERQLEPGDVIVLVTDGLLDSVARGADQEEWLAGVLRRVGERPALRVLDAVVGEAEHETGGRWDDDATVAVIRYMKRPAEKDAEVIPEYQRLTEAG